VTRMVSHRLGLRHGEETVWARLGRIGPAKRKQKGRPQAEDSPRPCPRPPAEMEPDATDEAARNGMTGPGGSAPRRKLLTCGWSYPAFVERVAVPKGLA